MEWSQAGRGERCILAWVLDVITATIGNFNIQKSKSSQWPKVVYETKGPRMVLYWDRKLYLLKLDIIEGLVVDFCTHAVH